MILMYILYTCSLFGIVVCFFYEIKDKLEKRIEKLEVKENEIGVD